MYAQHNPTISAAMRGDADIFRRGCLFALLSIRQPIRNVPAQMADVDERGDGSDYLFGFKRAAYAYIMDYGDQLRCDVMNAATNVARMEFMCQVPGLGLVKAGFVLQLMGYDVACLDSRNVKREGRNPRAFRTDGKKTGPAFVRKLIRYLVEVEGHAETYWDAWCRDVADAYDMTAHDVSALHLAILPDEYVPF